MIGVTGLQNRRRKIRLIDRVWEVFRFETESSVSLEDGIARKREVELQSFAAVDAELAVLFSGWVGRRGLEASVNPYFRSRQARRLMEAHGIRVVVPPGAQAWADLPIILPEIRGMLHPPPGTVTWTVTVCGVALSSTVALLELTNATLAPSSSVIVTWWKSWLPIVLVGALSASGPYTLAISRSVTSSPSTSRSCSTPSVTRSVSPLIEPGPQLGVWVPNSS